MSVAEAGREREVVAAAAKQKYERRLSYFCFAAAAAAAAACVRVRACVCVCARAGGRRRGCLAKALNPFQVHILAGSEMRYVGDLRANAITCARHTHTRARARTHAHTHFGSATHRKVPAAVQCSACARGMPHLAPDQTPRSAHRVALNAARRPRGPMR
jgi:hypothetical protein